MAVIEQAVKRYQDHGDCLFLGDGTRFGQAVPVPLRLQDGTPSVLTARALSLSKD